MKKYMIFSDIRTNSSSIWIQYFCKQIQTRIQTRSNVMDPFKVLSILFLKIYIVSEILFRYFFPFRVSSATYKRSMSQLFIEMLYNACIQLDKVGWNVHEDLFSKSLIVLLAVYVFLAVMDSFLKDQTFSEVRGNVFHFLF